MKLAVVIACLLVAVAAKPQFGRFGSSTGDAFGQSTQGQTSGLFGGTSQIQSSSAGARGTASGLFSSSVNQGQSSVGQSTGLFGSNQFANNQATSFQRG